MITTTLTYTLLWRSCKFNMHACKRESIASVYSRLLKRALVYSMFVHMHVYGKIVRACMSVRKPTWVRSFFMKRQNSVLLYYL